MDARDSDGGLTPGSVSEAWKKEDTQTKARYAKKIGTAGEMLYQSSFAEKAKNRMHGMMTMAPVATLTGRDLVFWNLPPRQKMVLPVKYSQLRPTVLTGLGALAFSDGPAWYSGDESADTSFSTPSLSLRRLEACDPALFLSMKLFLIELGVKGDGCPARPSGGSTLTFEFLSSAGFLCSGRTLSAPLFLVFAVFAVNVWRSKVPWPLLSVPREGGTSSSMAFPEGVAD